MNNLLENEGYIGDNVSTKSTNLTKENGRDDVQEVYKKGSRKVFSTNLEKQVSKQASKQASNTRTA